MAKTLSVSKIKAMMKDRLAQHDEVHEDHEAKLKKMYETHARARTELHKRHQKARAALHAEHLESLGAGGHPLHDNPRSAK